MRPAQTSVTAINQKKLPAQSNVIARFCPSSLLYMAGTHIIHERLRRLNLDRLPPGNVIIVKTAKDTPLVHSHKEFDCIPDNTYTCTCVAQEIKVSVSPPPNSCHRCTKATQKRTFSAIIDPHLSGSPTVNFHCSASLPPYLNAHSNMLMSTDK